MRRKNILLGSLALTLTIIFSANLLERWSVQGAAGFSPHKQFLPQILVDYCVSYPEIQPNDLARDKAVETGINNIRADKGLPILARAHELTQAALRHSNDMFENNFFSHTGSDGSSAADRIKAACYQWRAYGEIIAKGYETPQEVIAGWMESPGHQDVILSDWFEDFGAGYAYNPNGDDHYWTVDFGLRAGPLGLSAENYYSCIYYLGDEDSESWLSVNSIWPCGKEALNPAGLNAQVE